MARDKKDSSAKKKKEDGKEVDLTKGYAKTRKSLIARLENWEDQRTWDEFYQTYWKLIYSVGIKAGLRHDEPSTRCRKLFFRSRSKVRRTSTIQSKGLSKRG